MSTDVTQVAAEGLVNAGDLPSGVGSAVIQVAAEGLVYANPTGSTLAASAQVVNIVAEVLVLVVDTVGVVYPSSADAFRYSGRPWSPPA